MNELTKNELTNNELRMLARQLIQLNEFLIAEVQDMAKSIIFYDEMLDQKGDYE